MLFSSITFLYAFLPVVLLVNYLSSKEWKNTFLLLFSLIFYAWGNVSYTSLLIISIIIYQLFFWSSGCKKFVAK